MRQHLPGKTIVLKIGTSSLVTEGQVDQDKVDRLCEAVSRGLAAGLSPVLVASGAIAVGRTRHRGLYGSHPAVRQVAAALGQGVLYSALQDGLRRFGVLTGQLLLTPHDLIGGDRGDAVRDTLDTMFSLRMVPVVNENDALGVRNNDVLAALLSGYLRAELLLLLTDVPGLYDGNPAQDGTATRITAVPRLTPEVEAVAGDSAGNGGTGGMLLKLGACWIATYAGVPAMITNTTDPDVLTTAYQGSQGFQGSQSGQGDQVGTRFHARPVRDAPDLGRLWRAFRAPPSGSITCTPEGLQAIEQGAAITGAHVKAVHGTFDAGDVVNIGVPEVPLAARGSVRYGRRQLDAELSPDTKLLGGSDYVKIMEDQACG